MEARAGAVAVHYVEHGVGRPVLVLHGAGVDHRETEACFEPAFEGLAGYRRITRTPRSPWSMMRATHCLTSSRTSFARSSLNGSCGSGVRPEGQ